MILSFFENSQSVGNVVNLQSITIRLFGHYAPGPVGAFLEGRRNIGSEDSPNGERAVLSDQSGKKKTNPRMETAAVRKTTSNVAMPNGRLVLESGH